MKKFFFIVKGGLTNTSNLVRKRKDLSKILTLYFL